ILDNPGAVNTRLRFRTDEILRCLADSPHAAVALAGRSEQLDDLRSQYRRIEQKPAFIEHSDARLPSFAGGPLRRGVGDQEAHRRFKARVIRELLHIEKQPGVIKRDRGWVIEK